MVLSHLGTNGIMWSFLVWLIFMKKDKNAMIYFNFIIYENDFRN